jgi:probable F420-dependent oxidoreductase
MRRVARRAEDLGYASLWAFQRLLSPAGADLGPAHREVHDPLVALAHVAAVTTRIGLGTATVCAPFTAPVALAKATASLDVLSGGRLTVGLGAGWLPEEYAAAGVPRRRTGPRMEEYLRCLLALWTEDPVDFEGEFYTVPRSHLGPRPVQRPHPPLLLGGTAAPALRRAGRLADGWIASSTHDPATLGSSIEQVRRGAREVGRDPASLRFVVRSVPEVVDPPPSRQAMHRDASQVLGDIRALGAVGVTEVFVDLNLSPHVVGPGVDPDTAAEYADRVLEELAPAG